MPAIDPRARQILCLLLVATSFAAASAQQRNEPADPFVGQPGKDAIWIPTPPELVEKMLDLANVTARDFVMDLGSGDGRNVIGAARRGARALGVEYDPALVELSRRNAEAAGVADRAKFEQGDLFARDFSEASVLALFLLPQHLVRLQDRFLALEPGTRIVSNTFGIRGWTPDRTDTLQGDCEIWCTALVWIVPAKVAGTWRLPQGELTLEQDYQMVSGTLTAGAEITSLTGRLVGDQLTLTAAGGQYAGRVSGDTIRAIAPSGECQVWERTTPGEIDPRLKSPASGR
jgi:SAM-dependent methyltransferase